MPAESLHWVMISSTGFGKKGRPERRPCVLFVDTDAATLQATGDLIQYCGYETVRRLEADVALRSFERMPGSYDVVMIGCARDSVAGRQLATEVRRISEFVPIVFYVSDADEITREELHELHAWCILKPAPALQLAGTLMTLMTRVRTARPASTRATKSRGLNGKAGLAGGEPDQLGGGSHPEFLHQVGAVKLDGAFGDSALGGDLLVKTAGEHLT